MTGIAVIITVEVRSPIRRDYHRNIGVYVVEVVGLLMDTYAECLNAIIINPKVVIID